MTNESILWAPSTVLVLMSCALFQMVIGQQSSGSSSNLTELQVVNLDAAQSSKSDWRDGWSCPDEAEPGTQTTDGRQTDDRPTDRPSDWRTSLFIDAFLQSFTLHFWMWLKEKTYIDTHTQEQGHTVGVADPYTVYSMFWYINIYIFENA